MRTARALATITLVSVAALTGCSADDSGSDLQQRAAETATAWVEQLCQGQYGAANAMNHDGTGISTDLVEGDPQEMLDRIDAEAADRLSQLEADGIDTTPEIQVDDLGPEDPLIQEIDLSGTCYGQPFTAEDISIAAGTEPAAVFEAIPSFENDKLFASENAAFRMSPLEIDSGTFVQEAGSERGSWVLPPGEHTLRIPDHFLLAGPYEGTVTVDLFGVVSGAEDADHDPAAGAEAIARFWEECGEICTIEVHESQSEETLNSPLVPQPVQLVEGEISVTGTGAPLMAAIAPESPEDDWSSLTPRGWAEHDGYQGGTMDPEESSGHLLEVDCAEGETCSVPEAELTATGTEVLTYFVSEIDGSVHVTHLYPTGD